MIELFTAKSGAPSLRVDGVALHSPYDPLREARRFVRQALGEDPPSAVIILGESVGHIARAVTEACPRALLLSAAYSPEIAQAARLPADTSWDPSRRERLEEFLRRRLGELHVEGLRVLEWPPSARAFPAESLAANEAVRRVVQELNGSFVTTVAAGRLWLRNCFSNFLHVEDVRSGPLCPHGMPIVVAAPGPSLEKAAAALREVRGRIAIWALPSSCGFLGEHGMAPDLVVMTDPGFYALHHLQFAPPSCPLAMPLSAARGTWDLRPRPPAVLLEQPFLVERSLLSAAGVVAAAVPPHGTVSATAIELALASTSGPVIVAGLDLGSPDLLSHARPNAFDKLLQLQSSRLLPHYAQWFARETSFGAAPFRGAAFRSTPALRTYAGWLDTGLRPPEGRLYRFLPSPVPLSSMTALNELELRSLLGGFPIRSAAISGNPVAGYPGTASRRSIARRLLDQWMLQVASVQDAFHKGTPDLAGYPLILDLAQLVSPRRLVEALRSGRKGQPDASRAAAIETLDDCRAFLGAIAEKIGA